MSDSNPALDERGGMRRQIERDGRSHSTRNGLLCALMVAACVLIADPVANMPFSDDFSYIKTALDFARTGHFLYNGWATAMLGWLIPWGALVIKVFGFSFTVMRLSMLPLVSATVYLFHQILRRFGINSQNAVFGTLALALSPIFMPSAASFMTDIPGLLVIFLCIYMCQRAIATPNDRIALYWIGSATLLNLAGGTVRQIAWLGALVIVPSTTWLLRERRGMKIAGVLLWVFSLIGVLVCLHWFNKQPYSVPEHIIWAPFHLMRLAHLGAQIIKTFLCLLLVLFPVLVAWLPTTRRWTRNAWLRFAGVMFLVISLAGLAILEGRIDTWAMPWLLFLLAEQSSVIPGMFGISALTMTLWVRIAISLLAIAAGFVVAEQLAGHRRNPPLDSDRNALSWNDITWILGPYSFSYLLLLVPRGIFDQVQDRYLIGLVPTAIVILLRVYQERVGAKLPVVSVAALTLFGIYSIAGTHDFFAQSRAQIRAIQMIEISGVPRTSIQAGFPSDGWVQIQNGGHINEPRLQVPVGAYRRNTNALQIREKCIPPFLPFTPVITPKYFVDFPWFKNPLELAPQGCFVPAKYPPVHYTAWLPPFHATLNVQRLPSHTN